MAWPNRLSRICLVVRLAFLISVVLGTLQTSKVFASTSDVHLIEEGAGVPGLQWNQDGIKLKKLESDKGSSYYVTLTGTFAQSYTDLLWNLRKIVSTTDQVPQEFSVKIQISSPATLLRIRTVNARGEIAKSSVIVSIPDFQRKTAALNAGSNFKLSASLGYSVIQYREGSAVSLDMTGVTAKTALLYLLVPGEWDVGLSAYITALPVSQSITSSTTRFFGLNARVGYTIPGIPSPWSISLMAGGYYTTMMVSSNRFGFRDMMGPQLFPMLRYQLAGNSTIGIYVKYSPILGDTGILPFSQRELATGVSYTHVMKNGHPFLLSADLADLRLVADRISISSNSLSFSLGYGW